MTGLSVRTGRVRPCFSRDGVGIVPLTKGLEALVDLVDLPHVSAFNWHALVTATGHAYAMRSSVVSGKRTMVLMHRMLMNPPDGMVIDHINGNGLDNRRANIRICTQNDNMKNQVVHRTNKIGLKGVYLPKDKKRYRATIQVAGQTVHLGFYDTAEEAAAAYRGASKALYGEFANDPEP
jgi:hypothetical protein